ncbi:pi-plc x domain protein [Fusarium beomiforme]|uniref:Pi-plc x domain protein n=1 Tax=Fusarium beomiforme TaxID=44412 RepID=A0A9P5DVE4_9HYPO|nr:pi-plc x domain protein [Fusarium beomiforme]
MRPTTRAYTSARLQVLNRWASNAEVSADEQAISGGFPFTFGIPSAAPSQSLNVEANWALWKKSSIRLRIRDSSMRINLGSKFYNTEVCELKGPAGQAACMVAPTSQFFIKLLKVRFWAPGFFITALIGPGTLDKTLNSMIDANLDTVKSFEPVDPPTIPVWKFSFKFIRIYTERLECKFASVSKAGQDASWNMHAMLNWSGSCTIETHFDRNIWCTHNLKLTDLSMLLGITIDTTKNVSRKQVPDIQLHRLQASIAEIESMEQYNLSSIPETRPSQGNYQEWMTNESIQKKTLNQLRIPGTHDSAGYTVDRKLSTILEGGLEILLNFRKNEKSPSGHKIDDKEDIYIGPQAYDDLINNITLLSQNHHESKNIKQQLQDGIRFLDLRIYLDEDEKDGYYSQHFLRGPKLQDLLTQIREFLSEHHSSRELIIVEFAQANFPGEAISELSTYVAEMVKDGLGQWLYMPLDAPKKPNSMNRYNFQKFGDVRLSTITWGRPRVLFVSRDACIYPHSVLNVDGDTLQKAEGSSDTLIPYWFTSPPTNGEEAAHILLNTFDPSARIKNLRHTAYERNATAETVLTQKTEQGYTHHWRYMMDWYTESKSGILPIDLIVKANG